MLSAMPEIHHPHSVLWGERLDPAGRASDDGDGNAGLPARGRTRYRAFDESRTAGALRRIFRCLVRWPCEIGRSGSILHEEQCMGESAMKTATGAFAPKS